MKPGTTTYALLALLGVRPWSSYELTKQAQRSLRFVWPSSEANLYREQRRLVDLGWAQLKEKWNGGRRRREYTITAKGRAALRSWLRTDPDAPVLEVEGALRAFFADQGTVTDFVHSLEVTAKKSSEIVSTLRGFAEEYLETGSPFPERLHVIAIAMELLVQTHNEIERMCNATAIEVASWKTTSGQGLTKQTRRRFERILRNTQST